jgi:hypothetical protein
VSARYRFLPWVRRGASTAVTLVDTLGTGVPGRTVLPLQVRVNERVDVPVSLRLYAPGDVTGFDTRVVLRTDPPNLAADFEPNYFPSVELELPELPWLLTPAAGDAQGRLRPWLCLIAVRKQPGVTLTANRERPLPVLAIRTPARPADELPDLNESWAWAHSQVIGAGDASVGELLFSAESQRLSRLVCPRRLQPGQSYYAAIVPAFAAGRRAGLGELPQDEDEAQLAPAWSLGDIADTIELPVYFHWEFSTGKGGDFESLARRLRGKPVPEGVGTRQLHLGEVGFGLPDGGVLPLEGALRVPDDVPVQPVPPAFQIALGALLNLPDMIRAELNDEPIVAPPIYGSWQTVLQRIDSTTPAWVRELNLDPRHRAAAGLGVLVVQDQQEQLMASAWQQLADARQAQAQANRKALGAAVLRHIHAGLTQLEPEKFLQVTAPLHARVRLDRPGVIFSGQSPEVVPRTVREQIRRSRMSVVVTSPGFRGATRPHGPVLRRIARVGVAPAQPLRFVAHVNEVAAPRVVAAALPPAAVVSPSDVETRINQLIVPSTMLEKASQFSTAVRDLTGYLSAALSIPETPTRPRLILGQFQAAVLEQLAPARTFAPSVSTVTAFAAAPTSAAVLPGPRFPQPMYEGLRDLAPEMLLPGLDLIERDSITLLETNSRFIAAFMAGLNHEMSRELLWREYPSDLRSTPFRRFWAGPLEMPEMHRWPPDRTLDSQITAGTGDQIVMLIRGELLHRYPQTIIYAVRAQDRNTPGEEKRLPIFRAAIGTDVTCIGFDLTEDQVRGTGSDHGWFFVLEQPHGRARFGLDESITTGRDPSTLDRWNNLAWGDMAPSLEGLEKLTHAPVSGPLINKKIAGLQWGLNAGHMAAITIQRPVRVLQRAADLLPPSGEPRA